jgi:hypothetical protein
MIREQSVFVLKPDGVRSPRVRPLLRRYMDERSISVVNEYEFTCDADHVLNLWPLFRLRDHRVMREMYF